MPDQDELSFHDMEKARRKRTDVDKVVSDNVRFNPRPDTGSIPLSEHAPHAASVLEVNQNPARTDPDALQLRHVLDILQRHVLLIAFLTVFFPSVVFVYDNVLNRSYVPEPFRIGSQRIFSASLEMEMLTSGDDGAPDFQGNVLPFLPPEKISLDILLQRPDFLTLLQKRMCLNGKELSLLEKKELERFCKQEKLDDGFLQVLVTPREDRRALIETTGTNRNLLPCVVRALVPSLNLYVSQAWAKQLNSYSTHLDTLRAANEKEMQVTWERLKRINTDLARSSVSSRVSATTQDDWKKIEWEVRSLTIELDYLKRKVGYEKLAKQFFIAVPQDIQKVLLDNPLRQELAELEKNLAEARSRYLEAHPLVQQIRADIDAKRKALLESGGATSLGKVPPIPRTEELSSLQRVAELEDELELKKRLLASVQENLTPETAPERGEELAERLRSEREILRSQLADLRSTSLSLKNDWTRFQMYAAQAVPEKPYSMIRINDMPRQIHPRVMLHLTLAFLAGLLVGCSIAFVLEHMDDRLHTPADVHYHLHLPFLGAIPLWREKDKCLISADQPDSQIGEVYAHLCTNLRYGQPGEAEKRLLIASATQNEGKSTMACNLAIRYALEGHSVVLVDTDLRHPHVASILEPYLLNSENSPGLAEYLEDEMEQANIVRETTIPGLHIVAAGRRARNPVKLLGSKRLVHLLQDLEQDFDVVLIDSPAVLPIVDASVLAPHMYGILLVIAAHEVKIGAVKMALYRFRQMNAPVIGAVLNKVRDKFSSYTYYGYRGDAYGNPYVASYKE